MSGYLALTQAADLLSCDVATIRRWISQGKIPAYRVGDRLIRIKQDDLDQFIRPIPTINSFPSNK